MSSVTNETVEISVSIAIGISYSTLGVNEASDVTPPNKRVYKIEIKDLYHMRA